MSDTRRRSYKRRKKKTISVFSSITLTQFRPKYRIALIEIRQRTVKEFRTNLVFFKNKLSFIGLTLEWTRSCKNERTASKRDVNRGKVWFMDKFSTPFFLLKNIDDWVNSEKLLRRSFLTIFFSHSFFIQKKSAQKIPFIRH